jgi:hypothetical protein
MAWDVSSGREWMSKFSPEMRRSVAREAFMPDRDWLPYVGLDSADSEFTQGVISVLMARTFDQARRARLKLTTVIHTDKQPNAYKKLAAGLEDDPVDEFLKTAVTASDVHPDTFLKSLVILVARANACKPVKREGLDAIERCVLEVALGIV